MRKPPNGTSGGCEVVLWKLGDVSRELATLSILIPHSNRKINNNLYNLLSLPPFLKEKAIYFFVEGYASDLGGGIPGGDHCASTVGFLWGLMKDEVTTSRQLISSGPSDHKANAFSFTQGSLHRFYLDTSSLYLSLGKTTDFIISSK